MTPLPLLIIVNPAAGKEEPILELIARVFTKQPQVHVLQPGEKASDVIRSANYSTVAVYGGDGTITEAASALIGTTTPLAIIPGGTANVLAKQMGVPQDAEEVLRLIRDGQLKARRIDTATVNGKPFLLRVNLGLMADMITEADQDLKDKVGQLAYGVSAFKSWQDAEPIDYQLTLDGRAMAVSGVSLTVTNSGGMGIGDLQLAPGIVMDDGLLDVVLLREAGLLAVAGAAGNSLLGRESEAIGHWSCREVKISLAREQTYICDDCEASASELHIAVLPQSLTILC